MKKLIIWCVALCSFGTAYAQGAVSKSTDNRMAMVTSSARTNNRLDEDRSDADKVKTISRTFPADQNDKINLSNQFGSMTIKVWDKREVKIDVAIRASSGNDNEAQKLIDAVNISVGKNGDMISCKTNIDEERNHWWGRDKKREVKVDYVVYLPATNALMLSQEYGSVNIGDFAGPLLAKVEYGDFNATSLSNANNSISVEYGKTNIGSLNKATIKQEYGAGLIIGTAGELNLRAEYASVTINTIKGDAIIRQEYGSGLKIGVVNNLNLDVQYANVNIAAIKGNATINQEYNSLSIGSVGRLILKSEYAGVTIGNLRGDANFKMSYNNLNVTTIGVGCRKIILDAEYVNVVLAFADGYNADFTLQKEYGGFKYGANVKAYLTGKNNDDDDSSSKNYSGKIGSGGGANIRMRTEYGSVTFR